MDVLTAVNTISTLAQAAVATTITVTALWFGVWKPHDRAWRQAQDEHRSDDRR